MDLTPFKAAAPSVIRRAAFLWTTTFLLARTALAHPLESVRIGSVIPERVAVIG